ncbi:hypothetical protein MRB53_040960 [Persea americana]|nr:hypothetical protein MRB53_040960 [Persea americana]
MSSLQKQLAAIAAQSSHELDVKAQKSLHSQSLIFEASVAATQSFDDIYQLCLEGFEELCEADARFRKFEGTVFGEGSRGGESRADDRGAE